MTWVLFSGYEDCEDAERAFGALLELGIASEDLSLVARTERSGEVGRRKAARLVDSGQAHLEELRIGPTGREAEGIEGIESAIGGGIATDSFDDDVSRIEEMDNAQDVAERVAEPLQDRWYGMEDLEDAERFSSHGTIDATRPDAPGFGDPPPRRQALERPFSNEVLGNVLILGDGPLATEMLAAEVRGPRPDPVLALKASLHRVGVAACEAVELAQMFQKGGAVLAVTQSPGRVPLSKVEGLLEGTGAKATRSFVKREDKRGAE